MRNNYKAKKLAIRISAMALALVMVISLIGTLSLDANAALSLSGIEKIKNTGHLSILEIVPKSGSGSIGYYVGDQEPTSNWYSQVGNIVGYEARKTYADKLFTDLKNRGLMSPDATTTYDTYPLTYKGQYTEYKPWNIPENVDISTLTAVKLAQSEEQNVKGKIEQCQNGETGDYVLDNTYVYDTSGSAAVKYIENARYYEYKQRLVDTSAETAYYYHVDFEQICFTDDPTPGPGEVNVEDYLEIHKEVPLYTKATLSGLPYYVYVDTLSEDGDFTIDIEINNARGYYIAKPDYTTISTTRELVVPITVPTIAEGADKGKVDPTFVGKTLYVVDETTEDSYKAVTVTANFIPYPNAAPAENPQYYTQDQAHSYIANTDPEEPFREAKSGEVPFFRKETGYRYVGGGNGDHIFVYNPSGSYEENIEYDSIYVAGGYTNNEWFKRYVLDMDAGFDNFVVTVNSVTPDGGQLTAAMISSYDLVVVSAGFDLTNGNTIAYTADLRADLYNEIAKKPRVVDTGLIGGTYLQQLKSGHTTPTVTADNVYYFAPTIVGENTNVTRLATNQFHSAIKDANAANSPYTAVADEIKYENMLRASDQALSTDISMATCIRYVVNTHRIINKKTSLNVLDIQPAPHYDETGNNGPLTVATVLSWLPPSMQDQLAKNDGTGHNITITHMSTAALVGKIEDITEQYDLIYIGAATSQADKDYLDDRLDGDYHYANIGAKENIGTYIDGLLQTNDTTTRYSGNDLTPTKRDELKEFAKAKMPIVVSSELVTGDGTTETTNHRLTVKLTAIGNNRIKAEPVLDPAISPADYTVTYKWEGKDANGYNITISNNTASEITATNKYRYSCTVTVTPKDGTGGSAKSDTYRFTTNNNAAAGRFTESKNWIDSEKRPSGNYFSGEINNSDAVNGTLSVRATYTGSSTSYTSSYQWYEGTRPSNGGSNGKPVSESNGGKNAQFNFKNNPNTTYYCVITVKYSSNNYTVTSPEYTWIPPVSSGGSSDSLENYQANGTPGTVITNHFIAGSGEITLNTSKVDPNSLMYDALNSVWNLADVNILTESELIQTNRTEENEKKLVNALNLSRPAIDLSSQPATYTESLSSNGSVSGDCGGDLKFEFNIENITDPDPANTRYRCNLYVDQNGDGRHDASELIPGTTIESITNGTTKRVTNGTLQADTDISYRVSRSLNGGQADQFSGVVAWKLEVVKEGDSTVHASEKGYAYIQPAKRTELKVLQVKSSIHYFGTSGVDLSTPTESRDANGNIKEWETTYTGNLTEFQKLYKQLYNAGMYNISVETTTVNALNYSNGSSGTLRTQTNVFDQLNGYDMIVLGFEDCYGNLETPAANAVVDYINTGKSLLFTHDTTSYWNDPKYTGQSSNSRPGWGFWFNQVIRDKVGLDRYGATHPTYGKQVSVSGTGNNQTYSTTWGVVTKGSDGQINSTTAAQLQNDGYTVAYVPGNVGYSARETQGYTNSIIERNRNSGSVSGNKETNAVSQVNQGQITEYPYNLPENMQIQKTHSQYYQLNLNAEDVVVWYCLGGEATTSGYDYSDEKNDASNAYYIYNRGNITYSGAGHSTSLSANETKLFVNTMIAAYRAGNSAASVTFRTASDDPASTLLFPVQTSKVGNTLTTENLSGEQNTYFKISDRNLTDNKTISIKMYYEVPNGTTGAVRADTVGIKISDDETINANLYVKEVANLGQISRMDTGALAYPTALSSDVLYKTVVPLEVLDAFADMAGDGHLYLVATTTIHSDAGDTTYRSFDDLTLKKLGLLRLE